MRVKKILDEDFTNYYKPAMFIGTISCMGKCCIEAGLPLSTCHNDGWREAPVIEYSDRILCERYLSNPITKAIVFGGLEPFEQTEELLTLIKTLRNNYRCGDDIVIYTGYEEEELIDEIDVLSQFHNIIIKFGRYIPNKASAQDPVLGVTLASFNQYARKIS